MFKFFFFNFQMDQLDYFILEFFKGHTLSVCLLSVRLVSFLSGPFMVLNRFANVSAGFPQNNVNG